MNLWSKVFVGAATVLLVPGSVAWSSPIEEEGKDILVSAQSELVVNYKGEKSSFVEDSPIDVGSFLEERGKGETSFKYEDGTLVDYDDVVGLGETVEIYSTNVSSKEGKIDLVLPVKVIKSKEMYEGERKVVKKGSAGKAIKTTVETETKGKDGKVKSLKEESLTILEPPVQKVVKKGVKKRPVRETETASRSGQREASAEKSTTSTKPSPPAKMGSVVGTAMQFIGTPYVFGGSSPSGFDCSGFTQYVYRMHGVSLPRTSGSQMGVGSGVSLSEAQPGDLVITNGGGHVGIYMGGGQMIHSPRPGKSVEVTQVAYFDVVSVRRI